MARSYCERPHMMSGIQVKTFLLQGSFLQPEQAWEGQNPLPWSCLETETRKMKDPPSQSLSISSFPPSLSPSLASALLGVFHFLLLQMAISGQQETGHLARLHISIVTSQEKRIFSLYLFSQSLLLTFRSLRRKVREEKGTEGKGTEGNRREGKGSIPMDQAWVRCPTWT